MKFNIKPPNMYMLSTSNDNTCVPVYPTYLLELAQAILGS